MLSAPGFVRPATSNHPTNMMHVDATLRTCRRRRTFTDVTCCCFSMVHQFRDVVNLSSQKGSLDQTRPKMELVPVLGVPRGERTPCTSPTPLQILLMPWKLTDSYQKQNPNPSHHSLNNMITAHHSSHQQSPCPFHFTITLITIMPTIAGNTSVAAPIGIIYLNRRR